jgi:hypothetical protein
MEPEIQTSKCSKPGHSLGYVMGRQKMNDTEEERQRAREPEREVRQRGYDTGEMKEKKR